MTLKRQTASHLTSYPISKIIPVETLFGIIFLDTRWKLRIGLHSKHHLFNPVTGTGRFLTANRGGMFSIEVSKRAFEVNRDYRNNRQTVYFQSTFL